MLTGRGTGTTRADIINNAQDQAARYFGGVDVRCVTVSLSHEAAIIQEAGTYLDMGKTIVTGFTADWEAEEWHRWGEVAYGFPKCVYCRKENPS